MQGCWMQRRREEMNSETRQEPSFGQVSRLGKWNSRDLQYLLSICVCPRNTPGSLWTLLTACQIELVESSMDAFQCNLRNPESKVRIEGAYRLCSNRLFHSSIPDPLKNLIRGTFPSDGGQEITDFVFGPYDRARNERELFDSKSIIPAEVRLFKKDRPT